MLLYGLEFWGTVQQKSKESVHYYACKRYMCFKQSTTNATALGDCGRFPLYIATAKRCLSYWLKLLNMPNDR